MPKWWPFFLQCLLFSLYFAFFIHMHSIYYIHNFFSKIMGIQLNTHE